MPVLLFLIFILVPIVELAVLIQIGQLIGVWWTIALLIADAVLGTVLVRSQGRAAWRRFVTAVNAGRIPHREELDGVLVIFGGALLMTPGFVTDIFGALFLIPPPRALVRRLLVRRAALRVLGGVMPPRAAERNGRPADVEGTAVDVDAHRLDPPGGRGARPAWRRRASRASRVTPTRSCSPGPTPPPG